MALKKTTLLLLSGLLSLSIVAPVIAQSEMLSGTEAIAKRQELMMSSGRTMRGAGAATGEEAISVGETLVANYTQLMDLFPEDSQEGGETEALPIIWEQKEDFDMKMADALAAAEGVLAAAQAGDMAAYGQGLRAMGQTCGACHGTYREK